MWTASPGGERWQSVRPVPGLVDRCLWGELCLLRVHPLTRAERTESHLPEDSCIGCRLGSYAPAGIVWTVAPAGGANVAAGGLAEYDCSVTVLPPAFKYVRIPFEVDPQ